MNTISSQPVVTPKRGYTIRRIGQIGFLVISLLFAFAILFQVFLAGGGIFASSSWLVMHRIFGYALILFPVALLVLAVVGRQSWLKVGLNGLVIVLVVLQGAIINVAEGIGLPLFSALHPVNALLIFALCLALLYADWQDVRQSRAQA